MPTSERIVIYVTPELKASLEQLAKKQGGRSVNSLVREILSSYVASQ